MNNFFQQIFARVHQVQRFVWSTITAWYMYRSTITAWFLYWSAD